MSISRNSSSPTGERCIDPLEFNASKLAEAMGLKYEDAREWSAGEQIVDENHTMVLQLRRSEAYGNRIVHLFSQLPPEDLKQKLAAVKGTLKREADLLIKGIDHPRKPQPTSFLKRVLAVPQKIVGRVLRSGL